MSFETQDSSAADPVFMAQVRQAVISVAIGQVGQSSGSTNYAGRVAAASKLLAAPLTGDLLCTLARSVANDGATLPGATDEVVLERVLFLWPAICGG